VDAFVASRVGDVEVAATLERCRIVGERLFFGDEKIDISRTARVAHAFRFVVEAMVM